MVRRSSRLREKAKDDQCNCNNNIEEDDVLDNLHDLVNIAYSVIKENIAQEASERYSEEGTLVDTQRDINIRLKNKSELAQYHQLASQLNPGLDQESNLYFKITKDNVESVNVVDFQEQKFNDKKLMGKSVITSEFEKQETAPIHKSHYSVKKQKKVDKEKTAGFGWFNIAAPEMTPELKRDLTILKMRNVLDPKRHYKKDNSRKLPKYFQIGTIVSGAVDFYSSRLPNSKRKNTIVESLLADAEFRRYNKRKFLEIQASKQAAGRKGFFKRSRRKRR